MLTGGSCRLGTVPHRRILPCTPLPSLRVAQDAGLVPKSSRGLWAQGGGPFCLDTSSVVVPGGGLLEDVKDVHVVGDLVFFVRGVRVDAALQPLHDCLALPGLANQASARHGLLRVGAGGEVLEESGDPHRCLPHELRPEAAPEDRGPHEVDRGPAGTDPLELRVLRRWSSGLDLTSDDLEELGRRDPSAPASARPSVASSVTSSSGPSAAAGVGGLSGTPPPTIAVARTGRPR
jgi:hypothetical protein